MLMSHQLGGGGTTVPARWQITNSRETQLPFHSEVLALTTSSASLHRRPKDKSCTEAFLPPSLLQLTRLGCRGLGPSGNHNVISPFFQVFLAFLLLQRGKMDSPLSLGASKGRKRFSIFS